VVWDRRTGRPYYNGIVCQDTRTDRNASALERDRKGEVIRRKAGLPPATCFSAGKVQRILENVDGVRAAAEQGDAVFGNTDSWLLWNLTGDVDGGVHIRDVTNASRTMLMYLETLDWDDELLGFFDIPRAMLPQIRPPPTPTGTAPCVPRGPSAVRCRLTGDLGDQQAVKGRPGLLLAGRGQEHLRHRQLPAAQHRRGARTVHGRPAHDGLGSVQWLRDQLIIISGAGASESLARHVPDNGGVYFMPAFSGLFPPYWRSDARGAIVGLSRFNNNAHIARAILGGHLLPEQGRRRGHGAGLRRVARRAQGRCGVTAKRAVHAAAGRRLGVPVSKPVVAETTALGAAYAAGLAVG
jgi:glycerol kinase